MENRKFVSRAGVKLLKALETFGIDLAGAVCADLGCSTGGFTDCMLQAGAARVYAVDTGYGVLEWKLRQDERVGTMERTNALYAEFPEEMDFIAIDAGWTKQKLIVPAALGYLKKGGRIVTLVKPHYEVGRRGVVDGKVPDADLEGILEREKEELAELSVEMEGMVESPVVGGKGGNREFLFYFSINSQPVDLLPMIE